MIRNSKLSWEMKLLNFPDVSSAKMDMLEVEDFNAMLFHWKNLRVLHFSSEPDFTKFRLSLNSHKSLEKIVIPSSGPALHTKGTYLEHTSWGWVTEYWIDPSHLLTPTETIKNVVKLKIDLNSLPEDFTMKQNDCDLTNLETVIIYKNITVTPKTELLFRFKNLKTLVIRLEINITYLLDILHFLGNTKNVKIWANLEVFGYLGPGREEVEDIFNQALQIVKEKFPLPDWRILHLNISEMGRFLGRPKFSICYDEHWEMFSTIYNNYNNELENYDSNSTDGSGENSDTMDESVENSNSMAETSENSSNYLEENESSDTEEINVLD